MSSISMSRDGGHNIPTPQKVFWTQWEKLLSKQTNNTTKAHEALEKNQRRREKKRQVNDTRWAEQEKKTNKARYDHDTNDSDVRWTRPRYAIGERRDPLQVYQEVDELWRSEPPNSSCWATRTYSSISNSYVG